MNIHLQMYTRTYYKYPS